MIPAESFAIYSCFYSGFKIGKVIRWCYLKGLPKWKAKRDAARAERLEASRCVIGRYEHLEAFRAQNPVLYVPPTWTPQAVPIANGHAKQDWCDWCNPKEPVIVKSKPAGWMDAIAQDRLLASANPQG